MEDIKPIRVSSDEYDGTTDDDIIRSRKSCSD